MVFEMYTKQQLNIRAIARLLTSAEFPQEQEKRDGSDRRMGILRNPAYQGTPAMENRTGRGNASRGCWSENGTETQ